VLAATLPQAFQIGPLTLHVYGVIFASAVLAGYLVAVRLAPRRGIEPGKIEDLFLFGLPVSIIGARLYHVFDLWPYYRQRPGEILAVWQGGMGIYGGIIAGLLFVYLLARRRRLPLLNLLDVLLPALAVGQAIGRWGNFFNQEAFGPPTDLPWGIPIEPRFRPSIWAARTRFHPFFLYESLLDLLNFVLLIFLMRRTPKPGLVAGLYFLNYGLIRFSLEFLRWDTWIAGGVKVAHLLSAVFVVVGLAFLLRLYKS
jgi:phosphatidylglycerol:prolipoprotein diacylglycerol transferase